jgi:large subunit ribosomal protein L10
MDRLEKASSVESLKEKFGKSTAVFAAEFRGMTVDNLYALRKKVRDGQGELKIVKNRLAKIALKGTSFESLTSDLKGPVALAFAYKDAVAVAKALSESVSETSPLKIKVGSMGGKAVDGKGIVALSKLPSKEVLLSMMLSAIRAPVQNFASLMAAVPRDFVNVLTAVKNQKEKQA